MIGSAHTFYEYSHILSGAVKVFYHCYFTRRPSLPTFVLWIILTLKMKRKHTYICAVAHRDDKTYLEKPVEWDPEKKEICP